MNHKNIKHENAGVVLVLSSALLWGLFPVLVNRGVQSIPPLTFAAISILLAAVGGFVYALRQGKLHEIKKKESYYPLLMLTLFIVIIPYTLFFIGAKMTSGVNVTMLLLSELIFAVIFTPFFGEKTTFLKLLGAGGVFFGALFILYNGSFSFNTGDALIILSTLTLPFGNLYSKKALNLISPSIILFGRSLIGGLFVLAFALFFEPEASISATFSQNWILILLNGLIVLGLSKIFWFESLKRLDISKATSLVMTFPLFSIFTLIFFFQEKISVYQWIGIAIMMLGVYYSIRRPSVDFHSTKYAPS